MRKGTTARERGGVVGQGAAAQAEPTSSAAMHMSMVSCNHLVPEQAARAEQWFPPQQDGRILIPKPGTMTPFVAKVL